MERYELALNVSGHVIKDVNLTHVIQWKQIKYGSVLNLELFNDGKIHLSVVIQTSDNPLSDYFVKGIYILI